MDISVEVMLPERGSSDYSGSGLNAFDILSVVAVYDHLCVTDTVTMPRTGYVHVTGVPDTIFPRLQTVLTKPYYTTDPDGSNEVFVSQRLWKGDWTLIPANARSRLAADRQITVTWTAFKGFLKNIREQRAFTDADAA